MLYHFGIIFFVTFEQKQNKPEYINSTARDSLNGATPFDLAELLLDKRIPALTGQQKVSPDSVMLKPALINK